MPILVESESKDKTKKLELWTMWSHISIIYYVKINDKYSRVWNRPYKDIQRAGRWFRKYEAVKLGLKPGEMADGIKISVAADGEIELIDKR